VHVPAERPPSRVALVVASVAVAANLAVFVLVAEDLLDGGGLISRDQAVLDWFVDQRTDAMITVARVLSTIGSFLSLFGIGLVLGLWLWRCGRHLWFAVAPLLALSIGGLAAAVAKALFDRPRPPVSAHATHVASAAFPSGHATDAAAFFLAASLVIAITTIRRRWMRVLTVGTGMLLAGLVGLSRLVLGVHWLSDVIAGWALGSAFAIGIVAAAWLIATRPVRPQARASASGAGPGRITSSGDTFR
jgi:undecaprenyl-diphosphatase